MLKKIEVWDFESHEHTVVEDFSAGLNLICGESNAGKTSLVRALKLVAYNEFDPKSVRIGKTKCKVLVETDKGTVKVTRGPKDNLWEVTRKGQQTQYFDKVGKDVVPQAAEVMGMDFVSLGDVQVPVNIMDQHESHFMLKGLGDKDASGSMRAQIVDEISGLSGIEGLIKAVSLDNYREGREVKETEDRMEETRSHLHDENAMAEEAGTLGSAEKALDGSDDCAKAEESMAATQEEAESLLLQVGGKTAELAGLPDEESAGAAAKEAEEALRTAKEMGGLCDELESLGKSVEELEAELLVYPDPERAREALEKADKVLVRGKEAEGLEGAISEAQEAVERLESRSEELGDTEKAGKLVSEAEEAGKAVQAMREIEKELESAERGVDALEAWMRETEEKEVLALRERDEALSVVTVCPLTLGPVSEECMKTAREA